jgi:hypothetical protein
MAKDPKSHVQAYGLSHDAVADVEDEEGPALGAHTGRTRTNIPHYAEADWQGPKTKAAIKAKIKDQNED